MEQTRDSSELQEKVLKPVEEDEDQEASQETLQAHNLLWKTCFMMRNYLEKLSSWKAK